MLIITQISYLYLCLNKGVTQEYQRDWVKILEVVDWSQASNLSGGIVVRIPQELDVVALFLEISMSWLFLLWKNALESQCRDLFVFVSRHRGVSVPESWCRGFLVLEFRCRGFLVVESRCRGICASTASFLLSSWNQKEKICQLCWWKIFQLSKFVQHLSAQCVHKQIRITIRILYSLVTFV